MMAGWTPPPSLVERIPRMGRIGIMIVPALLAGTVALAQERAPSWAPPEPSPESKDWLRLASGEWLRGSILLMQDEKLSFDSEKLDELELDWGDVAEIRSPRVLTYGMLRGVQATGTSVMRDGVLQVSTPAGVQEYEVAQILAIIEGRPREANYWSLKASANLTTRSGNTDQLDLKSLVWLRRQTTRSQINLRFSGNYGELEGVETVNNIHGAVDANIFLSRRLFVTPVDAELYHDKFQNIDLRTNLGAGLGYYIIRDGTDWIVTAGGGYQRTRYISVQPGEDNPVDNASVQLGTQLETDLTSTIELDAKYNVRRTIGTDDRTLHRLFVLLSFDLIGDIIDLTASITWDYNTNPKPDADGNTPKKSDLTTAFGLGIDW
jgi:hypothetical protein